MLESAITDIFSGIKIEFSLENILFRIYKIAVLRAVGRENPSFSVTRFVLLALSPSGTCKHNANWV